MAARFSIREGPHDRKHFVNLVQEQIKAEYAMGLADGKTSQEMGIAVGEDGRYYYTTREARARSGLGTEMKVKSPEEVGLESGSGKKRGSIGKLLRLSRDEGSKRGSV